MTVVLRRLLLFNYDTGELCSQVLRAQAAAPGQKVVAGLLHRDQGSLTWDTDFFV